MNRFTVAEFDMNRRQHSWSYNDWLQEQLNERIPIHAKLIHLEKTSAESYRVVYEIK
jgi:hypothetical protein